MSAFPDPLLELRGHLRADETTDGTDRWRVYHPEGTPTKGFSGCIGTLARRVTEKGKVEWIAAVGAGGGYPLEDARWSICKPTRAAALEALLTHHREEVLTS